MLWLTPAVAWLDYNANILYDEAVLVGLGSRGAITLTDLAAMDFDQHRQVVSKCKDVVKRLYGKEEKNA